MGGYLTPAYEASLLISGLLDDEVRALTAVPDFPIYHYTTCEALLGIIRSGVLRANSLDLMNDAAEIRFAASVFRSCLDRRAAVSSGRAFELLSAMQARMRAVLSIRNVYSVSFSKSLRDVGMWKLYAEQARGFAFSVSDMHSRNWADYPLRGALYECSYGERALAHLCAKVLEKAEELFQSILDSPRDDEFIRSVNPDLLGYDAASFAAEYLNAVGSFAPVFKPEAWHDEREFRRVFVRHPAEDNPSFLELDLSPRDGAFGIASIIAGPECRDEDMDRVRSALNWKGTHGTSLCRLT